MKTIGGEIRCWLLGRAVVVAGRRRRFRRLGLEKEEEEENAFVGLGSGRTGPGKLSRRKGIRGRVGFGMTVRVHVGEEGQGGYLQVKEKRRHQRERVKREFGFRAKGPRSSAAAWLLPND